MYWGRIFKNIWSSYRVITHYRIPLKWERYPQVSSSEAVGHICSESFIIITLSWLVYDLLFALYSFYCRCLVLVWTIRQRHLLFFMLWSLPNTINSIISCFGLYGCGSISYYYRLILHQNNLNKPSEDFNI